MKKMIRIAFFYVILALIGGVFYREFTKFNGFTGVTVLADVHVHLMVHWCLYVYDFSFVCKKLAIIKRKTFFTVYGNL